MLFRHFFLAASRFIEVWTLVGGAFTFERSALGFVPRALGFVLKALGFLPVDLGFDFLESFGFLLTSAPPKFLTQDASPALDVGL